MAASRRVNVLELLLLRLELASVGINFRWHVVLGGLQLARRNRRKACSRCLALDHIAQLLYFVLADSILLSCNLLVILLDVYPVGVQLSERVDDSLMLICRRVRCLIDDDLTSLAEDAINLIAMIDYLLSRPRTILMNHDWHMVHRAEREELGLRLHQQALVTFSLSSGAF